MNWGMRSINTETGKNADDWVQKKVYIVPPVTIIRITRLVLLLDLCVTVIFPLGVEHYNMKSWWDDQVLHYTFISSAFDLLVPNIIRIVLIAVACMKANQGSAVVRSNGVILHEQYSIWSFKVCSACAVVSFIKFILAIVVVDGTVEAWSPSLSSFIMCIVEDCCIWSLWKNVGCSARSSLYEKLISDDKDIEAGNALKYQKGTDLYGLAKVLMPYFWPSSEEPDYVKNRIRSVSTWIIVIVSKILSVISPLYLGVAVTALYDGNVSKCVEYILWYTLFSFGGRGLKELQLLVYLRVKQTAYIAVAMTSFSHIHRLSLQWHVKKKIGNVMRSMDRGNTAADNLVMYLFLYLTPCLFEIFLTIFVFFGKFHDWRLGLEVLFFIWLYMYTTIKLTIWRMGYREKTNIHDNIYHDKATDSIINYETVKYFTNEDHEASWFRSSVKDFIFFSTGVQISLSVLNVAQQFIVCACICAGLITAAHSITRGLYDVGQLVTISLYLTNIFVPLSFLGTVYNIIVQAFIDIKSLTGLLSDIPDVVDAPGAKDLELPPPGSIGMSVEFKNVSFHYPGQPLERGIHNINITVKPGSTTALVGSTGAGKTTMSRLMFRFYDPLEGVVLLNGQDISKVKQKSARGVIGVVPQDTVLFNASILHNISYGRVGATMSEIRNAAEAAQILDFILSLPEQWDTKVGERGLKLSGGEKQRVAIARCLLKNPPIVLLDEATSALDSITESSIQQALQSLSEQRTTVIIAHRLSTIRHADQICVMEMGSVVEMGSHNELIEKNGIYFNMWDIQQQQKGDSPFNGSQSPNVSEKRATPTQSTKKRV